MTYKYRESIKDAISEVYSASASDEMNRHDELAEAYVKAGLWEMNREKLDQWEGKVKAFDKIVDIFADFRTLRIHKYYLAEEVINEFYENVKEDN